MMEFVMVKAGIYKILENGTTKHKIRSKTLRFLSWTARTGYIYRTYWYLDDNEKSFLNLRSVIKSLNYKYENYPGPMKLLEKAQ